MLSAEDTIVAIATPPGRGGLAVVRLSGSSAVRVARSLIAGEVTLEPRRATLVRVLARRPEDPLRPVVDEAVATLFAAPASATGEDVVELSVHGSVVVAAEVVGAACRAGARLAEPGEFSLRAFLNGRMDLTRAEAVQDLVGATTRGQARLAFDQLQGGLAQRIGEIERLLFDLSARLEAAVDFPEEGDGFIAANEARGQIEEGLAGVDTLLRDGARGRMLREGASVAIVGRPNVGKSTLFNRLAGVDRAIVTEVPGTTRDVVTEVLDVGGVRVTLADTAGIRVGGDKVEEEGVRRAERAATTADVVVVVLDGSEPLTREDRRVLAVTAGRPRVVVVNKCESGRRWQFGSEGVSTGVPVGSDAVIEVSGATGMGMDALIRSIDRILSDQSGFQELPAVSNIRHIELLERAREALTRARDLLSSGGWAPEELVLADVDRARAALEEVTGKRSSEDLLNAIFSKFCIGK
jgi:tRNA modification GTPase